MKILNFILGLFVALLVTSCTIEEECYPGEDCVDGVNGVNGKDGENAANGTTNAECYHYDLNDSDFTRGLDSGEHYVYEAFLWGSNETDDKLFDVDLDKDIVNVYVHTHINNGMGSLYQAIPATIITDKGLKLKIDYSIAEDESSDYVKIQMELLSKKPFRHGGLGDLKFKVMKFSGAEGTFK
jgi:hypothetical protein